MKFSHMVSRMRLGSASIVDLDRCSVFPDGLDQTTMLGGMLSTVPPQCAIRVRIGRRVLYECRQADHSYRGLLVNLFHTSSSLFRGVSAAMHPFPAIHFE